MRYYKTNTLEKLKSYSDPIRADRLGAFFRGMTMVFLAPHTDDIALSCGGIIPHVAKSTDVTIAVFFSRTAYGPGLKTFRDFLPGHDFRIVTETRLSEETSFCDYHGIELIDYRLQDSSLRGIPDEDERLAEHDSGEYDHVIGDALGVLGLKYGVLFCPLSLGTHVDHVIVNRAVRSDRSLSGKIIYYEDLPYAARCSQKEIEDQLHTILPQGAKGVFVDITDTMDMKIQGIGMYKVAVMKDEMESVLSYAGSFQNENMQYKGRYMERLWIST
jgi:LmbE family N-acetylglucosaminyl deacetylase